jgi:hypothetical protein
VRVFIDIDDDVMVRSLGVPQVLNAISFKRTELVRLEVQFCRNGQVIEYDETALGIFELKLPGQYDSEPLTGGSAWNKVGTTTSTYYYFTFTLVNDALDALFFVDGNPNNDIAQIKLMGEVQWTVDGGTHKTQTIDVTIDNDVIRVGDIIVGGGASPDYLIDDTDPDNPQFVIDDTSLVAMSDG